MEFLPSALGKPGKSPHARSLRSSILAAVVGRARHRVVEDDGHPRPDGDEALRPVSVQTDSREGIVIDFDALASIEPQAHAGPVDLPLRVDDLVVPVAGPRTVGRHDPGVVACGVHDLGAEMGLVVLKVEGLGMPRLSGLR